MATTAAFSQLRFNISRSLISCAGERRMLLPNARVLARAMRTRRTNLLAVRAKMRAPPMSSW
eukprot:3299926-Prymnesium_polylepis.2